MDKIDIKGVRLDEVFTLDNSNINGINLEINRENAFNINDFNIKDFNNETKEVTVIDFLEEISYKGWSSND